ncbi:MAG: 50S ribosome-binding GTPase, partial [Malacoplasma sp.]|nr:50S ribosome-binding GTPase [Malacoplasma sp.]
MLKKSDKTNLSHNSLHKSASNLKKINRVKVQTGIGTKTKIASKDDYTFSVPKKYKYYTNRTLLIGAPNVGKSTFFNHISNGTATVSNIDRMTVDTNWALIKNTKNQVIVDLPGVYNLSHPIDEELVVADVLMRGDYRYITNTSQEWSNYDPREANIEQVEGYQAKLGPIAHLMLYGGQQGDGTNVYATSSDTGYTAAHYNPFGYVGVNSDLYKDYIGNIYDIQSHLIEDVDQTELKDVRNQFRLQSKGNKSPQIILDYLGNGLTYQDSSNIKYACFDYPTMKSEYVNIASDQEKAITRDIGGNGGFISLVKHVGKSEQNELNKDFIQFFLSPYGQTFYYKGLKEDTPEGNGAPTGLSTVKANLLRNK